MRHSEITLFTKQSGSGGRTEVVLPPNMGPENSKEMDVEERIKLQRQHTELSKKLNTAAYYAEHGFRYFSLTKRETAEVFILQTDEDNCPANIMKDAARRIESYYLSRYKAISAELEKDRQSND